jgi:hypothetical protein
LLPMKNNANITYHNQLTTNKGGNKANALEKTHIYKCNKKQ